MQTVNLTKPFKAGDCVIYRKTKHSVHPGPRARNVSPNAHGDEYTYLVDKFWIVEEVLPEDRLVLRTRRGKQHTVSMNDPNLRKARFWERFLHRDRFEAVAEQVFSN